MARMRALAPMAAAKEKGAETATARPFLKVDVGTLTEQALLQQGFPRFRMYGSGHCQRNQNWSPDWP